MGSYYSTSPSFSLPPVQLSTSWSLDSPLQSILSPPPPHSNLPSEHQTYKRHPLVSTRKSDKRRRAYSHPGHASVPIVHTPHHPQQKIPNQLFLTRLKNVVAKSFSGLLRDKKNKHKDNQRAFSIGSPSSLRSSPHNYTNSLKRKSKELSHEAMVKFVDDTEQNSEVLPSSSKNATRKYFVKKFFSPDSSQKLQAVYLASPSKRRTFSSPNYESQTIFEPVITSTPRKHQTSVKKKFLTRYFPQLGRKKIRNLEKRKFLPVKLLKHMSSYSE